MVLKKVFGFSTKKTKKNFTPDKYGFDEGTGTFKSRVWPPRRFVKQLHGLGHKQWPQLCGESHEVIILKQRTPMIAPVSVIFEFP